MQSDLQDTLAKKSGLTNTQIQSIVLQKMVRNGELTAREAVKKRGRDGVTSGAYHRVVSQARSNIEESIYTLLLCSQLGVLQLEDLRRLIDTIAKLPPELDAERTDQVTSLINALIHRIVML